MGEDVGVIVDYQTHWYPPALLDALVGREHGYPRAERVDGRYGLEAVKGRPYSFSGYLADSFVSVEQQLRVADTVVVRPDPTPAAA